MTLVQGINHVAIVTADLDRLASFYGSVFDAPLVAVEQTPFGRLGIVRLGEGTALNIFEVPDSAHAEGLPEMLGRGHLDHLGIDVIDMAALRRLRERLVAGGHSSGEVTDFGPVLSICFTDPDGMTGEINLVTDPSLTDTHEPRAYELPEEPDSPAPPPPPAPGRPNRGGAAKALAAAGVVADVSTTSDQLRPGHPVDVTPTCNKN